MVLKKASRKKLEIENMNPIFWFIYIPTESLIGKTRKKTHTIQTKIKQPMYTQSLYTYSTNTYFATIQKNKNKNKFSNYTKVVVLKLEFYAFCYYTAIY